VDWVQIGAWLAGVPAPALGLLVVVWLAGLWAYTYVVTAALPGLTRGRAFRLNAVGGAASNVLPLGGALGAVLTYAMARSWGHDRRAVLTATVVSNTCNVLGRLVLPALGLGVLLLAGRAPDHMLALAAGIGAVVCAVSAVALAAAVWSAAVADVLGGALDTAARRLPRRVRPDAGAAARGLHQLRAQIGGVVHDRWPVLCLGMAATLALQGVLFAGCLQVTGADPALSVTLAAFAVSRALTTVVVTPNGVGVSEAGTAVVLVALGVPGVPAAAAVLLFGLITHVFEVMIGALAGLLWAAGRRVPQRA
jgi:uncharacterized membrane protein YbhN (UPF0104 family)